MNSHQLDQIIANYQDLSTVPRVIILAIKTAKRKLEEINFNIAQHKNILNDLETRKIYHEVEIKNLIEHLDMIMKEN